MKDSLEIYLQSRYNGIHIDIRPKKYYPDGYCAQTVTLPNNTIISILYEGVLHYIHVQDPTPG